MVRQRSDCDSRNCRFVLLVKTLGVSNSELSLLVDLRNMQQLSIRKHCFNYLRSTMCEDRLNGLAHLYINRDVDVDYRGVIEEFARFNRRLSFV